MGNGIAIIAGTGVCDLFDISNWESFDTPYGKSFIGSIKIDSKNVLILLRHGPGYVLPPHKINYRANIFCLKQKGAKYVIATNAVGSMNKKMRPGDLVLPDQIIDFTKRRFQTFFEGEDGRVVYTDVTNPYSESLRRLILKSAKRINIKVHSAATYVCTEGPRFETASEIKFFRKIGCDVVGMTGAPEVFLAMELGLEYASIAIVTNWAAGIAPKVSHEEVIEVLRSKGRHTKALIQETVRNIEV